MADCGTPQSYGDKGSGGSDWSTGTEKIITFFDPIQNAYSIARNTALLPVFVLETLRDQSTYISSSRTRLQQAESAYVTTTESGTIQHFLGPLDDIFKDITNIFDPSSKTTSASEARTAITASTAFSSESTSFFIDFAPFNRMTVFCINSTNQNIRVTVTADIDQDFENEVNIGTSSANPFTVNANSRRIETLTDALTLIRFKVQPLTSPTTGTFSLYSICRG